MTYPPQPGQWNPGPPPPGYYPPPQKQGGGIKWLLIAIVVLLVVISLIGITLIFTLGGSESGGTTSTAAPGASDVASANDTGAVAIITSEPTCAAWRTIQTTLANAESEEWGNRDPSSESSSWTPQLRAQYEAAAAGMRGAADQVVGLAKQTPHRVMREMYEQFIIYGRAYADSLSSYQPRDNWLSLVNVYLGLSIAGVCDAIDYGGIVARAPLVPAPPPPNAPSPARGVGEPDQFVTRPNSSCTAWDEADSTLRSDLAEWTSLDSNIPASAWTPEHRRVAEAASKNFGSYSTTMENLGQQEKGTFEDFANLAALYLRAYAAATPSYIGSDGWIYSPGLRLSNAVKSACRAVKN